jgi:hypothetical protein
MQKTPLQTESVGDIAGASQAVCVHVMPGICGFTALIKAQKIEKKKLRFKISESECGQIKKLAAALQEMDWKDLFVPLTRNPVYVNAEKSGCHPSCIMPAAMLKAAEVAMGMAIPKDVAFRFQPCDGEPNHET